MTQLFREDGQVIPVTIVTAGPCFVTYKKDLEKDGYRSVQLGSSETKRVNKPLAGFFKKFLQMDAGFKNLKEFRLKEDDGMYDKLNLGQQIDASIFNLGDIVSVQGVSKGKGFQGVVKRHGFHGSPASHGHKDQLRMPGSIGATGPAHVFKGTKMGGHMGNQGVTVDGLEVVKVEDNLIYIKGALPGARHSLVYVTAKGDFEVVEKAAKKEEAPKPVAGKVETEVKEEVKEEKPVEELKKDDSKKAEVKAEEKETAKESK